MSLLTSAVSMTKAMVQIDSTDPGTYEKAMADWIEQQLSDLSNVLITRENVLPGRPNLMAEIPGPKHLPALVMICHMDTVVIGDGWTLPPFEAIEKDGKIYGRGACDMKSGLAAMIFAIEALVKCGITPHKSILFTAVIDEEVFFKGTRALIDTGKLKHCTRAYVSEPTSLCIATSLQGAAEFTARTYGKAAHCGMAENGINAIIPMAEFATELNKLNDRLKGKGALLGFPVNPSLNVGSIKGGIDITLVPDYCEMNFDRQVFPGEDMQQAIYEIHEIFKQVCSKYGTRNELTCNQYFNYWKVDKAHPVAQTAVHCHEMVTGSKPDDTLFRAYTEVEMIAQQGIPGIIYGPGSILQAHRPDEYVELDEFITALKTYALIGLDFIR